MSNAYTLPDDICRCHDATCQRHEECLRWLARKSGTPDGRCDHEDTLRIGNDCSSFKPVEPDAPFCGCGD